MASRLDYTPSFPFGVPNPYASRGDIPEADGSNVPWETAPATSHVWGWKYVPLAATGFFRRATLWFGEGYSHLFVRFRNKTGGIAAEYVYGFKTREAGQAVLEKLRGSGHPYAEVVRPLLINAGVVYTALSRGA